MKFGVCVPNYGETGSVEAFSRVAIRTEELGYDSVWTTDHVLMPARSGTPYERILDSITSLAYLSGITNRIKLGISSLILAMRNPVVAVKQLATIDYLSGGRLMLATSAGWNETEFNSLGSNFHDRGRRLNENIRLIRALWEGGVVEFEGKRSHVSFKEAVFEPRPMQRKLTVWVSGNSKAAMTRAINFGDAWHPNVYPLELFKELVTEFRRIPNSENTPICVRIGINMKGTSTSYIGPQGERRLILTGNMTENRNVLSELAKMGVVYSLIATSPDGKATLEEQLESLTRLSDEVIRRF